MMTRGQLVKVVSQATIPKIAREMAAMIIMIFIEYPNSLNKRKRIVIPSHDTQNIQVHLSNLGSRDI